MNAPSTAPSTAPHSLRVEHLDSAIGIHVPAPRLSWQLPDGAHTQHAYRITADNGWDTGWVTREQQLLVPYTGPRLVSSQRVTWQVAVRTESGTSPDSSPGWFETGLVDAEDWHSPWIEPAPAPNGPAGDRPAALLRHEFRADRRVVRARLYATAQGLYEAFLNGIRVGDAELTPGFTQYDARLQVQTVDVTDLVVAGRNALAVVLADGWFRGQIGITRASDQWGDRVAFLGQLHLTHDDGSTSIIGTGPGWRSATGHILAADLIAGERVDLRALPRGWDTAGFDDSGWAPAAVVEHGYAGLVASDAPPVRRVEELVPVAVTRLAGGRQVVDLGQNINGWIRLTDLGPAGTTLTLTHGEWLDADGDVTVDNLRPDLPFLPHPLPAGQVDQVVSAGLPGDAFEPRRTTHGFRYVRIEGHPGELTAADVRGVVVHTDMRRTGWFSCSDTRLERLHEAAVWSFRDNACDIPTDCPHRERAGWTGDWQLFVPTAAFLYDVAGLSTKWLRDVAIDQWPDGTVANISPTARAEGRESPIAFLNGSAGWGDAAVIVPWELYWAYGDVRVLAELWPTMVAWIDRTERIARTERHPARAAARPQPAAHERYLWDAGFHWGEWLVPGEDTIGDLGAFGAADKGDIATAYFAYSSGLMAKIAAVLGRDEDAARYAELYARVRDAWQTEYLEANGRLSPDTQANHVRALAFDLVPAGLRPAVADRLVKLVADADTHLRTGFLDAAVAGIADGATVLVGGFGPAGQPVELIDALRRSGVGELTVVNNNSGNGDVGLAALLAAGRVRKLICSFPRQADSWVFDRLYRSGQIELELVPQGNLAERLRAAGAGIGAFYTPTSVGTPLAQGREIRTIEGRDYLLEFPLHGDAALIKAHRADTMGNLFYRKTARNFGPVMASAAALTIVEVQEVVAAGALDPEAVVTPGIFVDRIVACPMAVPAAATA